MSMQENLLSFQYLQEIPKMMEMDQQDPMSLTIAIKNKLEELVPLASKFLDSNPMDNK